jgi:hypothetical protein
MTAICGRLELGFSRALAVAEAGIGERTLYDWISKAGTSRDPDGVYADFVAQMRVSEAKGEGKLYRLAVAQARGTQCPECGGVRGDPHMTRWLLATKSPERYGAKIAVRVQQELAVHVQSAVGRLERAFAEEPEILERVMGALVGETGDQPEVLEAEIVEPVE